MKLTDVKKEPDTNSEYLYNCVKKVTDAEDNIDVKQVIDAKQSVTVTYVQKVKVTGGRLHKGTTVPHGLTKVALSCIKVAHRLHKVTQRLHKSCTSLYKVAQR